MAKKASTSVPSRKSFADTLLKIGRRFPLFQVFEDFLTMSIAACTINPKTKLSYYEDEYLSTIASYKDSELRFEFPSAFSCLIIEMEERLEADLGNDILGDFFEQHISNGRNGQFFTPYPVCRLMASITQESQNEEEIKSQKPLRILDPACGSGRLLLASHGINGVGHEYYGIDIDRTCVKMAALNLFLHGMWNSEVMCANGLNPDDFVISYRISSAPLGIFKIEKKEHSLLWNLQKNSFSRRKTEDNSIVLDTTPVTEGKMDNLSQLKLF